MASTVTYNGRAQIERDTLFSNPLQRASRRSPFFTSSPSLSSNSSSGSFPSQDDSPFSPNTPLRFLGVPFAWEQRPGIPKKQLLKKKDPSLDLLPLPPAGTSIPSKKLSCQEISPIGKKYTSGSFHKDPFFAALVECSKDDDVDDDRIGNFWKGSKVTRTLSDRFGFINMYASCKATCAVSESIVYLPRSSAHSLLNRRPS